VCIVLANFRCHQSSNAYISAIVNDFFLLNSELCVEHENLIELEKEVTFISISTPGSTGEGRGVFVLEKVGLRSLKMSARFIGHLNR